jgi:hypothetical protein
MVSRMLVHGVQFLHPHACGFNELGCRVINVNSFPSVAHLGLFLRLLAKPCNLAICRCAFPFEATLFDAGHDSTACWLTST